MEGEELHIVMLPWLAFGHMIPFLYFAIALAEAGLRISFLCTPRNIGRLPKIPPHLASRIRFVELHLPQIDGLPEHAEATFDVITLEQVGDLINGYGLVKNKLKQFLESESPDYIIFDLFCEWVSAAARESGVLSIYFSVFSAATISFFGTPEIDKNNERFSSLENFTRPPKWITFPCTVALRPWEAGKLYTMFAAIRQTRGLDGSYFAVAFRSCKECEGEFLEVLQNTSSKPVIPVGLIPPKILPQVVGEGGGDRDGILRWLDGQRPRSVVFVSFGSECRLSKDETHEMAYGLELANLPFLWAMRRLPWVAGSDEEMLPEGFRSRNQGRGLVTFGWAPQTEILAHASTGGSLFHSGWGSVIETLRHGHALVLLPMVNDQALNARSLVEKGLAVEVERDEEGSFSRHGIAAALRTAMVSEEGAQLREKARAMGAAFSDQTLQDKYVKNFVDFLRKSRKSRLQSP